jgi:hypothetical protein
MGKPQQLNVAVTYSPAIGYISQANDHMPRSLSALSLTGLRKRIVVALLNRPGRRDRSIAVRLDLDDAARAELQRRG